MTSEGRARGIMGRNMFGIEDSINHLKVEPRRQELTALADIPFTEATLEQCRGETHVLVAVFERSILDIFSSVPSKTPDGRYLFYGNQGWRDEEFFVNRGNAGWWLIRKTPIPNSMNGTWQEQRGFVGANEEIPGARVMTYAIIGHYLATGERLIERAEVRCSDTAGFNGNHVIVGCGVGGLRIDEITDTRHHPALGIASVRRPDQSSNPRLSEPNTASE